MKTIEWASGLFEGEGCITNGKNHCTLKLAMTDKDVVEMFHEVFPAGNLTVQPPQKEGWKTQYVWRTNRKQVIKEILSAMLPHLGQRRAYKALNCLDELDNI